MKLLGKVSLLSAMIALACASGSADSSQRFSALEARITRLESLLSPDAGLAADVPPDDAREAVVEPNGQGEKLSAWLDAQLIDDKKDVELTNQIRARVAKETGAPVDSLDIVCATHFCRFGPSSRLTDGGAPSMGVLNDEFSGYMMDGEHWYAPTRGYALRPRRHPGTNWGVVESGDPRKNPYPSAGR